MAEQAITHRGDEIKTSLPAPARGMPVATNFESNAETRRISAAVERKAVIEHLRASQR